MGDFGSGYFPPPYFPGPTPPEPGPGPGPGPTPGGPGITPSAAAGGEFDNYVLPGGKGTEERLIEEQERTQRLVDRCLNYIRKYRADQETLQKLREKTNKAYMQEPYGNEIKGRSQIVSADVFDTIESIKPSLARIFWGGTDVVKIEAQGKEDEEAAKLLNEKVNFDLQKGINGFLMLIDWFDDALKMKLGVVKYWWNVEETYKKVSFSNLPMEAVAQQLQDPNFQADSIIPGENPMPQNDVGLGTLDIGLPPQQTFSVTGKKKTTKKKPMAEVLPPEEFIGDVKALDYKKEDFVAHWKRMHYSEIVSKYDVERGDLQTDADYIADNNSFYFQRFKDLGGVTFMRDETDHEYYYCYECYVNDYESGQKEPKKLMLCGPRALKSRETGQAVEENSYGHPPFCFISPVRLAHRAIGRSIAELAESTQLLKTALKRYIYDNIYYQNNGIGIVNQYNINVDDVLNDTGPGGRWRVLRENVDLAQCYRPLDVKPLAPWVIEMLDKATDDLENHVGVTRYNQGTDSESLNKTAHGISQIMTAAQQKIDFIARIFAETGVKDLYTAFAKMNIEYGDDEMSYRLNEEWKSVARDQIDIDFDVTINAGLGAGTREMTVQQMLAMLNECLNPAIIQSGCFTPDNLYQLLQVVYENMGRKDADRFVTDPQFINGLKMQIQQLQQQNQMLMMGGINASQGALGAGGMGPGQGPVNGAGLPGQGGVVGGGAPPPGIAPPPGVLPTNGAAAIQ